MEFYKYDFDPGDILKIKEVTYVVQGFIKFKDCDGAEWEEYKLKSQKTSEILWLSVDKSIDGYVLYRESYSKNDFLEENILANGFKKFEECRARVINYGGKVDVDLTDRVFLKEYSDDKFKHILSVEEWEDETEYSKGTVYSKEKVIKTISANKKDRESKKITEDNTGLMPIAIGGGIFFLGLIFFVINIIGHGDRKISEVLHAHNIFSYVTSVTSDLDNSKKADVFSSNSPIEYASRILIDSTGGKEEDLQENSEDCSVILSYKDEIALVYKGEDSKTLIQVSNRDYIFCSRVGLYNGDELKNSFLRSYYVSTYYQNDRQRFGSLPDASQNYKGSKFIKNNKNKYIDFAESVRQESSGSRSSSGGGTSAGK